MEFPVVDGKIILKWIFRKWDGVMDWIGWTQDRDVVQEVMDILVL